MNIDIPFINNYSPNTETIDADIYGINYEFTYDDENSEAKITNVSLGEKVGDISIDYKPEPFTIDDYCKINPYLDDNDNIDNESFMSMRSVIDMKNKRTNINTYRNDNYIYDDSFIANPEWLRLNWDGNKIIFDEYIFAVDCLKVYNKSMLIGDLATNISENKYTPPIHEPRLYTIYEIIKKSPSISYDDFSTLYNDFKNYITPTQKTIEMKSFQVSNTSTIFDTSVAGPKSVTFTIEYGSTAIYNIKVDLVNESVSFENNVKYINFQVPVIPGEPKITAQYDNTTIKDIIDTSASPYTFLSTDNVNISFEAVGKKWNINITGTQYVFPQQISIMDIGDRKLELTGNLLKYNDHILEGSGYDYIIIDDDYIYHEAKTSYVIDKLNCLVYNFNTTDNKFLSFSSLLSADRAFRMDNNIYNKLIYNNYIYTSGYLVKINQPITINKYPTYNKYNAIVLVSKYIVNGLPRNIEASIDAVVNRILKSTNEKLPPTEMLFYRSIINPRFEIV